MPSVTCKHDVTCYGIQAGRAQPLLHPNLKTPQQTPPVGQEQDNGGQWWQYEDASTSYRARTGWR